MELNHETLNLVLSKMLHKTIFNATYQLNKMQAGSVGEVYLITGMAESTDCDKIPYKIVLKKQKKWDRQDDIDSWRREYDLYSSNLDDLFADSIHRPKCYHAEISDTEMQIWMEYIGGVTAMNLTSEMYEQVATELGRFQGKIYNNTPIQLQKLKNLSKIDAFKNAYKYFKSLCGVYEYIRSDSCEIPKHLCDMLIDTDNNAEDIWNCVSKLPIVLCHRDPFVWNVFVTDNTVTYIDWDSAGWGYMGEDIVNLLADDVDVDNILEYYHKCVPAYCNGFAQYADISHISNIYIIERIIMHFGYRLADSYMRAKSSEEKMRDLAILQKFFEITN